MSRRPHSPFTDPSLNLDNESATTLVEREGQPPPSPRASTGGSPRHRPSRVVLNQGDSEARSIEVVPPNPTSPRRSGHRRRGSSVSSIGSDVVIHQAGGGESPSSPGTGAADAGPRTMTRRYTGRNLAPEDWSLPSRPSSSHGGEEETLPDIQSLNLNSEAGTTDVNAAPRALGKVPTLRLSASQTFRIGISRGSNDPAGTSRYDSQILTFTQQLRIEVDNCISARNREPDLSTRDTQTGQALERISFMLTNLSAVVSTRPAELEAEGVTDSPVSWIGGE